MISPKGETDNRPRRFYTDVDVAEDAAGWVVRLDTRPLRTPGTKPLAAPTAQLAELLASEWRAQGERIDFASMPAMRLMNVVIDRTPGARAELALEVARYAGTDLVCYLATDPRELVARQEAAWAPLRAWAHETIGANLNHVRGIVPVAQPDASLEAVRAHAAKLDDYRLTALVHGVTLYGSAVLGLAVERGRLSALEAYEVSRVDETFQAERWGADDEALSRAEVGRAEARMLDAWFAAL